MKQTHTTTKLLIQEAHAGQKYGNMPYFFHPIEVSEVALELFQKAIFTKPHTVLNRYEMEHSIVTVALLHDVIEDTDYERDDLAERYDGKDLDSLELVTKDEDLDYEGNIQRIVDSKDIVAMFVKLGDNNVNRNGDKSSFSKAKADRLNAKYDMSIDMLTKAFAEMGIKIR